ncbi:hypothetical protein [Jiangella asiatica]|uniref:Aminotransferase class I/II-fold pyridoxal phosphate-dependent enzyme n=1 Tax=Jiangella asiatica TaxID=2530372 RepID=A0A4R5D8X9_9ACTN|nr:hypothetical protein [Jiangella asiatica]TDE08350.1 hypothetical protein E1269_17750 [Jiangella asiatica]
MRVPSRVPPVSTRAPARHGVRVLPGGRTTPDGTGNDHLRLSFVADPQQLPVAIDRLTHAWTAFRQGSGPARLPLDVAV